MVTILWRLYGSWRIIQGFSRSVGNLEEVAKWSRDTAFGNVKNNRKNMIFLLLFRFGLYSVRFFVFLQISMQILADLVYILCDFLCSCRFLYFFKRGADSARGSSNMYGLLISTEKMRRSAAYHRETKLKTPFSLQGPVARSMVSVNQRLIP